MLPLYGLYDYRYIMKAKIQNLWYYYNTEDTPSLLPLELYDYPYSMKAKIQTFITSSGDMLSMLSLCDYHYTTAVLHSDNNNTVNPSSLPSFCFYHYTIAVLHSIHFKGTKLNIARQDLSFVYACHCY